MARAEPAGSVIGLEARPPGDVRSVRIAPRLGVRGGDGPSQSPPPGRIRLASYLDGASFNFSSTSSRLKLAAF